MSEKVNPDWDGVMKARSRAPNPPKVMWGPHGNEWVTLDAAGRPWVEYRYPLRNGNVLCTLLLPRDLTSAEVARLSAFIASLVVPEALRGTGEHA